MDSFEVNKIIGALLGVVFVIFSVSLISDAIFASPAPEKPGYAIEAMEGAAESGGGAEEEKVEDIKPMLASADVEKGAAIFKRCSACHTDDKSGANKVGPNLWGVVGRPIASHEGFSYSAAMKEFSQGGKEHWTYDHLNNFLHDPKKVVPGTAMGFAGLPKAEDRANVIAYLRTQADEPQPLPSPEEMAKEGGDKAAAEGGEGGEKAGAEGGEAAKAGEAAEGADAAKAPADKTEGAAQGSAPAAGTDQQGTTPEAGAEQGNAPAATGQQDGTGSEQVQPENQNAPAAESSTTESGTSGSGQRAEPDASNQDEPNANTPTTDSDEVERNQGEGSGSAQ